jgi:L-ascorbate metabolism protein UlaG (beta-lactamase superfamily)
MPGHWLRWLLRPGPGSPERQIAHDPPPSQADSHRLRFLGTAGFTLESAGRTFVLDPYLSRAGLLRSLAGRLTVDEDRLRRLIPRADDVLIGHAHHDHILDAPALCRQTGARLIGSRATCMVGRAAGVPEAQLVEVRSHEPVACGPYTARAVPSLHGRAVLGRVPLPGDILTPPPWPPRLRDLRHGQVLLWWLDLGGTRILHVDSADWIDRELDGYSADILCLCAIGRHYRPGYTADLIRKTGARVVVPCHWDDFTLPLEEPPRQLPGVDLDGFIREIRDAGAEPRLLGLLEAWTF